MDKRRIAKWAYGLFALGFCIYLSLVSKNIGPAIFAVVFIAGLLFVARKDKEPSSNDASPSSGNPAAAPPSSAE
jgi:hypothetical protein